MPIIPLTPRTRPASPMVVAELRAVVELYDRFLPQLARLDAEEAGKRVRTLKYLVEVHGLPTGEALTAISAVARFILS